MSDGNREATEQRPEVPLSGVVYGDIIYWGTIASALIALVGQILAFVTRSNYISPSTVIAKIWHGEKVDPIWQSTVGARPDGEHWYLQHLATGDGLTMFGIALGVFVVIPAILASAWVMFTRERRPFFGILAVIAALITIVSFLGLSG